MRIKWLQKKVKIKYNKRKFKNRIKVRANNKLKQIKRIKKTKKTKK